MARMFASGAKSDKTVTAWWYAAPLTGADARRGVLGPEHGGVSRLGGAG